MNTLFFVLFTIFLLWGFAGIMFYIEKTMFSRIKYTEKQKAFLRLVCGPLVLGAYGLYVILSSLNKKFDEFMDKLK